MWNGNLWDSSGNTLRIQVRYDLKSGKAVYRSYMVSLEESKNLWKEGYDGGNPEVRVLFHFEAG